MDWILTKLDGFWRSGCGRLSQDVVNLPNAREHIERGVLMGVLCVVGSHANNGVLWAEIVAWVFLGVAVVLEAELIITELLQHSWGAWRRVVKFCFTGTGLTELEIAQRYNGGPLDGLADLFFKLLTGLPLFVAGMIVIIERLV